LVQLEAPLGQAMTIVEDETIQSEDPGEAPPPDWRAGLMKQLRRFWPYIAAGVGALVVVWLMFSGKDDAEPYRTAKIDRGAIARTVSATGTLQPLVSVNVGSTVSGPVESVDVDFNSRVRAGQVLARLDPTSFQQRVVQAQANLAQANANVAVADADYQRYLHLQQAGFASEQLMQQQLAVRDSARAVVAQAAASLASARTDLDRTVIKSPIDGVVVDRQVNPGQSVAASFQAPTLFVIAQDLSRLQANIVVDEADIGEVREGQVARFTVDAFPDRQFEARVSQVRQQGASDQGVVSYTVVVQADNPGRQLLPGMTANAEIVIEEQPDVLRIANAALRFRPADPAIAAKGQAMAAEIGAAPAPQAGGGGNGGAWRSGGGGQGGGQGGQAGGRGVQQWAERLELTPAQQTAMRNAFQQAMAAAGDRPGQGASQSERRAFMRRVREAAMREIEPTLTDHQKQLLAQLRQGGDEGRTQARAAVAWVLRGGKPTPVQISIGVADNVHTAVVGGGLKDGDEVIIGGGPSNAAADKQKAGGPFGGGPGVRIRGN
jgi:HlyD family secretion protein